MTQIYNKSSEKDKRRKLRQDIVKAEKIIWNKKECGAKGTYLGRAVGEGTEERGPLLEGSSLPHQCPDGQQR